MARRRAGMISDGSVTCSTTAPDLRPLCRNRRQDRSPVQPLLIFAVRPGHNVAHSLSEGSAEPVFCAVHGTCAYLSWSERATKLLRPLADWPKPDQRLRSAAAAGQPTAIGRN